MPFPQRIGFVFHEPIILFYIPERVDTNLAPGGNTVIP